MKFYSVPADFNKSSVDRWIELNQSSRQCRVYQTYGQITESDIYGSGRANYLVPQISLCQLEEYVYYSTKHNISFAYTLNTSCVGNREFDADYRMSLYAFLKKLREVGVQTLIISMPSLIEIVNSMSLGFSVTASAISHIDCAYKANFYKRLGVSKMVLDPDVVRDVDTIKQIVAAFGDGVELIVNNACKLYCPYKIFHYNHESHATVQIQDRNSDYYYTRCTSIKTEDGAAYLRCGWIRPEDIPHYNSFNIQYFKIQGRQDCSHGDIFHTVQAYFKEDYQGNLMDLLNNSYSFHCFVPNIPNKSLQNFINPFMEGSLKCHGNCSVCKYCETYAKKYLNYSELSKVSEYASLYYRDCDAFTNSLDQENNYE